MPVNVQTSDSVQLANAEILSLKQVFKTINAESCPRYFNFHMHTICSDGNLKPEELISQAIAIGLKGLAITDHHTIGGYEVAKSLLDSRKQQWHPDDSDNDLPHLWTGVEITSNLLGTEVHILGYAFDPEHPAMLTYLLGERPLDVEAEALNAIAAIHQAGGLAVLAHPARYRLKAAELIPEAARLGIDGVETYYAYNNPNPWRPSPEQTEQVQKLSATYGLFNTCGTDTHGLNLLQRL